MLAPDILQGSPHAALIASDVRAQALEFKTARLSEHYLLVCRA
jgi:hypothetical protein